MIRRRLSHFHILERIGEGSMGVVYRTQDEKLQRVVGWAMATHLKTELALEALNMAVWQRRSAHPLVGLTHFPPVFAMLILGAAFVLVPAAMWPSVPLVVEKERVGVAFGIMTMIQNVGLMAFPVLNGKLRVMTGDYTASQVMFACLGALGLFFALGLLRADRRAGHVLERPHAG